MAFSTPTRTDVKQVVVTGPGAPSIASLDDLAGREVFVRKGSIYDEPDRLEQAAAGRGKPPSWSLGAPPELEDDDILGDGSAGLAPITIVDDYLANFWARSSRPEGAQRPRRAVGRCPALAFRKDNPQLRDAVSGWLRNTAKVTGFAVNQRRYLET